VPLTEPEFADLLRSARTSALRLELQRAYLEPAEQETVARFRAGDPEPPTEVAALREWFAQVADQFRRGVWFERVRVHEDPPSDYQRWERWIGAWNIAAGEKLRYMTRAEARRVGLLPAAGDRDWWLLDDDKLIVMQFDDEGRRCLTELTTAPERLEQARSWWRVAVQHSVPEEPDGCSR
jgi:hypothetical protein